MNTTKKRFYSIILMLVLLLSLGTPAEASQISDVEITNDDAPTIIVGGDDNNYVMTGQNGTTMLVKSISSAEYTELMDILYPNGVVDEQGQEIGGINDMESVRETFISNHMRAYSVNGTTRSEITLTPFTVTLKNQSNGDFEALFYSAHIGQDSFAFPSEWGNQPFGFTHKSEKNIYLAFTDMGIWNIDPDRESATQITMDTFMGQSQAELSEVKKEANPESYLLWIDNVEISPDGEYVVYRTNRDADALDETSIWTINLNSNLEKQAVSPAENNDIIGFIDEDAVVVGALNDTRMINVSDSDITAIDIPNLPNACVKSVKNGKIIISSYNNGSSSTTAYINNVNMETGEMSQITSVSGYLDGEPDFSPSGSKIAIGYGKDAMMGTDDVVIIDTLDNSQTMLTEALPTTRSSSTIDSSITRCLWIDDDTVLVDVQEENEIPATTDDPSTRASAYSIVFGNTPPSTVNFISPLSTTSTSGFVGVNSKWNQPRSTGSNPHNGVDLQASLNTNVYAPYAGWATGINVTGPYDVQFLVDANKNRVQDDGDYYIRFYHMNAREGNGYKTQGQLIGKSGNQGGVPAHLHFGICSVNSGLKWLRNEVNYRYLTSSHWASGQDLDIYSQVRWNNNTPSIIAYIRDDGAKKSLSEVRMYYRTTTSGAWTDGGVMTKSGDTYTYNFNGKFSTGTTVYWMVRLTRSGVSQTAFCPAKYYQPANDPNASANPYGYWTNTMT